MTATTLVVLGLAVVVVLGASGSGAPASADGAGTLNSAGYYGAMAPSGLPLLDFHLRDQDGVPADLDQYRGRVVILTFMYSTCQDTCPVEAQQIRGALDDLGQHVPTLAVSVDPANDTPNNAKSFMFKASLTGRMRFLLGTRAQLAPVWREYGIQPQNVKSKVSDHSAYVLLLDRSGRQRVAFPDSELTPEALAHDIRKLEGEPA